jgi:hypothetical protein
MRCDMPCDGMRCGAMRWDGTAVGKTPFRTERGVNMMALMTGQYGPIGADDGDGAPRYAPELRALAHACLSPVCLRALCACVHVYICA